MDDKARVYKFLQEMDDVGYNFLVARDGMIYEGRSLSLFKKGKIGKSPVVALLALLGIFLAEIFVTSHEKSYENILSSMPDSVRQKYLDYVLSREYGPFRNYTHKVNALKILQRRIALERPLSYDPTISIGLLEGGMDGHWEPIPVDAAKVILLANEPKVYEALFREYREDRETLSAFNSWIGRMRALYPDRYPDMRREVDIAAGKMSIQIP